MNLLTTATKFLRKDFLLFCSVFFLFAALPNLHSACTITITGSGPCRIDPNNSNKALFKTPTIGEVYPLYVKFHVQGTTKPFNINFVMGPKPTNGVVISHTNQISVGTLTTGDYFYWAWFDGLVRTLEYPLSWSISIDPAKVSGNSGGNVGFSGVFSPIKPTNIVTFFDSKTVRGYQSMTFNTPTAIQQGVVIFGDPPNLPTQTILADPGPGRSLRYLTQPLGINMFLNYLTNVPAGPLKLSQQFTAQLSSVAVNGDLMRQITWQQLSNSITPALASYLQPDSDVTSTDPAIIDFVNKSLPSNFKNLLSPYETARRLHLAVAGYLTYKYPPPGLDNAKSAYNLKICDCGGFANLLEACLRIAGIPARTLYGFWLDGYWNYGNNDNHCRSEFYLPGVGWILADAFFSNYEDKTGTYAYDF